MNLPIDSIAEKVQIRISRYEGAVVYYDLTLQQNINKRDSFQFRWRLGNSPILDFKTQADIIRKYVGAKVKIHFKDVEQNLEVYYKGVITAMEMLDADGASEGFMVYGTSPDILLDDIVQSRVYEQQNLSQIIRTLADTVPKGTLEGVKANIYNDAPLDYVVQYNETDYAFMQRLAKQYGKWMYYDGTYLQFGKLKGYSAKISSGINLHEFRIKSHLKPQKSAMAGYDYNEGNGVRAEHLSPEQNSKSYFSRNIQHTSQNLFRRPKGYYGYTPRAESNSHLEELQILAQQGREAGAVIYSGRSVLPLQIGGNVKIIKESVESKFVATRLRHHSKGLGHYDCYFEAIPSDVKAPPYTDPFIYPYAETQPATVTDNNDPQGMGRVQVRFSWGSNSKWLRMVTPHAGGGKGFYFVPEIGEEVLVGFEGGNPESPFVMGTHYNGAKSSEYGTAGNDFKVIKTRSGHKLEFEELKNIKLTDAKGNYFHIDSSGENININANETLNITAKNINITASENINVTAGMNITENAGMNHSSNAGAMMSQNAVADYSLMAANIMEYAKGERKSRAKEMQEHSEEHFTNSQGKTDVHAQKELSKNSGEQSKFH